MKQQAAAASAAHPQASRARWIALLSALLLLVTGTIAAQPIATAWAAADYPSWNDVLAARNNEKAKQNEVVRIERLIATLQEDVDRTEKIAREKGDIAQAAQLRYEEAKFKADQLQEQADAAQAKAEESLTRAGQLAARVARVGGGDLSLTLFFNGDEASDLLSQLGMASKISGQAQAFYDKAIRDQQTAQALTDQANVAKEALKVLFDEAQAAFEEAKAAQEEAAAALAAQETHIATLRAQLATLRTNRIHTEAEYVKGVQEQWGSGAGGAEISSEGWARPAVGNITSGFGYRVSPCAGCSSYHQGVDLGASCNTNIRAAHAGTVEYVGWYGGYGNYIRIDHGGGIKTAYGHIVNGGFRVSAGQIVAPGQVIALVGTTGASTGCHLHFEVHQNGSAINPITYMAARGIQFR